MNQTLVNQPPETTLADYRLVREAGFGAMSIVYEAIDLRDGQTIALKVLPAVSPLSAGEQQRSLIARLQREARMIARLDHPNIVHIRDVGEWEGRHYLAMEYLNGVTLRDRLDTGPLPLPEAIRIVSQVGQALDAIHAQGVIHRDVKPSNVMLLPDGRVKLMDFGVARRSGDTAITQTGMIVGTPAYMSPEQIRGDDGAPASDLWALGVLLYEMLAGHPPFPGPNISAVLHSVTYDTLPPIPGTTSRLQKILRKALDKKPPRRYRTAQEFSEALHAATIPPGVGRPRVPRDFISTIDPQWQRGFLAFVGLAAVIIGAIFLAHRPSAVRTAPTEALTAGTPILRSLPGIPPTQQAQRPIAPTIQIRENPLSVSRQPEGRVIRPPQTDLTTHKRPKHRVKIAVRHYSRSGTPTRKASRAPRQHRRQTDWNFSRPQTVDYQHNMPTHPVYDPQGPA